LVSRVDESANINERGATSGLALGFEKVVELFEPIVLGPFRRAPCLQAPSQGHGGIGHDNKYRALLLLTERGLQAFE